MKLIHVIWGQIAVAFITFGGLRLYTELLDPESFGFSMLCLGAISLLDGISVMALTQILIATCSQLTCSEDRRQMSVGLLFFAVAAAAVLTIVATALCAIASLQFPQLTSYICLPATVLAYLAVEFTKSAQQALLNLRADYLRLSIWSSGEAVLGLSCTCALLTAWRADWVAFLCGYGLSRLVSCILFTASFSRVGHFKNVSLQLARSKLREALRFGLPVAAMAPLGWISSFLDRFIIGSVLGAAETGTYVAATSLTSRPYALTSSVLTNYFRPQLYETTRDRTRFNQTMLLWLLSALSIGAAGAVCILLAGELISRIMLAAPYRQGAALLMFGSSLAQTMSIATHSLDNAVLALGRSGQLLRIQIILSILPLAAIPIGVVLMGPIGAVAARCLVEMVKLAGTWALTTRVSPKATG